jgi:uncharacterized protein with NRDE domain
VVRHAPCRTPEGTAPTYNHAMCLLAFGWRPRPGLRLALVGNRDEFHVRPTAALHAWPETPGLYAGRDLQAGGTWCGVGPGGRVAALTNFRTLASPPDGAPSRGELVSRFLQGTATAAAYAAALQQTAYRYAGFSLLLVDAQAAWVVSNRAPAPRTLDPGVYGLSNAQLDTPWPKLLRSREALRLALQAGENEPATLAALLQDSRPPSAAEAAAHAAAGPETTDDNAAVERLFEERYGAGFVQAVGAPFVLDARYGTRATTAIVVTDAGDGEILEWQHAADGTRAGAQHFRFGPT